MGAIRDSATSEGRSSRQHRQLPVLIVSATTKFSIGGIIRLLRSIATCGCFLAVARNGVVRASAAVIAKNFFVMFAFLIV